jgi:RHS repeat-associated protein
VRQYSLRYHDLDAAKGRTISCLASVQEFGETDASSYPAVTMAYTENPGGWDYYPASSMNSYLLPGSITHHFTWSPQGVWDYGAHFGDLDGDGLTDVLANSLYDLRNTRVRYVALNTGSGWNFDANLSGTNPWSPVPSFTLRHFDLIWSSTRNFGATLLDLDGDTLPDLAWRYVASGVTTNYLSMNTGSGWTVDTGGPNPYRLPAPINRTDSVNDYRDYGARFGDLNGDGLVDALWSCEDFKHVALNNGAGWDFNTTDGLRYTPPALFAMGTSKNLSYGSLFADINGDGLADILWSYDAGSTPNRMLVINEGDRWGRFQDEQQADYLLQKSINRCDDDGKSWDYGARFADLNGDGLVDVLWASAWGANFDIKSVALNTGAGWFLDENTGGTNPRTAPFYFTTRDANGSYPRGSYVGDINGDNLPDIVWSYTAGANEPRDQPSPVMSVTLSKGRTPNLLSRIDNDMGGFVDVEYTPSSRGKMKLHDPATGMVEVSSKTPYALDVVSKITRAALRPNNIHTDEWGTPGYSTESYSTLYRYAGAKHLDREFRGFAKVKEIDAQSGNFKITEFHQDYARRGRVRSERSYVSNRLEYRDDDALNADILDASKEDFPRLSDPRLVSETYYRYRVVISEDDELRLKTYTDTDAKLGLVDFPKGMTLVTPACALTQTYEYGGDYSLETPDVPRVATAEEKFYDGRGNLVQSIDYGRVVPVDDDSAGALEQPRIDATFQNDSGTDADGRVVKMIQYERRRLGTWMDVPVLENTAGYHTADFETGRREVAKARILEAKRIDYDSRNQPVREVRSLNTGPDPVVAFQYDVYGNKTKTIDARGYQTVTVYDPIYHAFAVRTTRMSGLSDLYVVDPGNGNLVRHTDMNGRTREARHDGLGRVVEKTNSTGQTVLSYSYGFWIESAGVFYPNRVRTTIHTPTGNVWEEAHYDGLGRAYQKISVGQRGASDPVRVVTEFNDRGFAWKQSWPHWTSEAAAARWSRTYLENDNLEGADGVWGQVGLDRPVERRRELNLVDTATTRTVYELPLRVKTIDARGNERRVVKDAFDNVIGVWEPDAKGSVGTAQAPKGAFTQYGWDALKRLEYVRRHLNRDTAGNADPVTNVFYDTLGRKTAVKDPDAGVSVFHYDPAGNPIESVDARGCHVLRSHDAMNRLTALSYSDLLTGEVLSHVYYYDEGVGMNLKGRLARVVSPGCDVSHSYDADGRATREIRVLGGASHEISMQYDYAGRETRLTYPDGTRLDYKYNAITQSLDSVRDADSGQVWLAKIKMSPFGSASELALGNGVARNTEFDYAGRGTRLLTRSGGIAISDLRYRFDPNSNIRRVEEVAGPSPTGDMRYAYDSLDRLVAAFGTTMSGMSAGTQSDPLYAYSYDPLGRMTFNSRFLNPDHTDRHLEYEYSEDVGSAGPVHGPRGIRLTQSGLSDVYAHRFEYDAAGNLTRCTNESAALAGNKLDRRHTWDALGRLGSVQTPAGTTAFEYDHSRNRVKKVGPSGQSVFYIGQIAEVTAEGMTKHVFAGGMRIGTIRPDGEKLFYMTDHLQSSTLITDEAGEVVERMDYEPYGAPLENARAGNAKALRHTFTGRESDAETDLMYYGSRYYDPVMGMFISPDHLVPNDTDPQLFNRFSYARNNPIVYSDPTGEFPWLFVIIGVIIGAALAAATAVPAYLSGQINLGQMIGLILLGGLAGGIGGGLGAAIPAAYTGASVAIQIILGTVGGIIGGAASGFLNAFGSSLILGNSLSDAWNEGVMGAIGGAIVGGIGSFLGSSLGAMYSGSIGSPAVLSSAQKFWKIAVSQLGKQTFNFINSGVKYALNLAFQ